MNVTAIIETPAGSIYKYEINKKTGILTLDRPLNQPIPYNYGYIPNTVCEDGDALDVFVLTDTPIYPLSEVKIKFFGVLKCLDSGLKDDKILATLVGDCLGYGHMGTSIIEKYLETYKNGLVVLGNGSKEEAIEIYKESLRYYESDS